MDFRSAGPNGAAKVSVMRGIAYGSFKGDVAGKTVKDIVISVTKTFLLATAT